MFQLSFVARRTIFFLVLNLVGWLEQCQHLVRVWSLVVQIKIEVFFSFLFSILFLFAGRNFNTRKKRKKNVNCGDVSFFLEFLIFFCLPLILDLEFWFIFCAICAKCRYCLIFISHCLWIFLFLFQIICCFVLFFSNHTCDWMHRMINHSLLTMMTIAMIINRLIYNIWIWIWIWI